jgi:hypothetical protein
MAETKTKPMDASVDASLASPRGARPRRGFMSTTLRDAIAENIRMITSV